VRSDPPTHGVDGNDPSLAPHLNRFGRHTPTAKTTIFKLTLMGTYQWEALYRAVRGEALKGAVTPLEIAQGIAIVEAMAKAEQSGNTVKVDNPRLPAAE